MHSDWPEMQLHQRDPQQEHIVPSSAEDLPHLLDLSLRSPAFSLVSSHTPALLHNIVALLIVMNETGYAWQYNTETIGLPGTNQGHRRYDGEADGEALHGKLSGDSLTYTGCLHAFTHIARLTTNCVAVWGTILRRVAMLPRKSPGQLPSFHILRAVLRNEWFWRSAIIMIRTLHDAHHWHGWESTTSVWFDSELSNYGVSSARQAKSVCFKQDRPIASNVWLSVALLPCLSTFIFKMYCSHTHRQSAVPVYGSYKWPRQTTSKSTSHNPAWQCTPTERQSDECYFRMATMPWRLCSQFLSHRGLSIPKHLYLQLVCRYKWLHLQTSSPPHLLVVTVASKAEQEKGVHCRHNKKVPSFTCWMWALVVQKQNCIPVPLPIQNYLSNLLGCHYHWSAESWAQSVSNAGMDNLQSGEWAQQRQYIFILY